MTEKVNHPSHYNHIAGIECIDVVEHMPFNLANAVKYIWRCEHKENKIEDLRKAIWYLNREISRTENFVASRDVCSHFVPIQQHCARCKDCE